MTQQLPYRPSQQTAPQPQNGLGLAGFVLGLIGLLFSPIPFIGVIAWPLVILGLIFSAIGLSRANKGKATNKGLAVSGLVVSILGLVICIVWVAAFGKAVDDANTEANREATITYEVTGDAANVTISYTTFGDSMSSSQESAATLPWSKEVKTKGYVKGGSLVVIADQTGGTVNCTVLVDGKEAKTSTATGEFATATCGGF